MAAAEVYNNAALAYLGGLAVGEGLLSISSTTSSASTMNKKDTEDSIEKVECTAADLGTIIIFPPDEIMDYIGGMDLPDCISLVCNNYDEPPYNAANDTTTTSNTMDLTIWVSCEEDDEGV